MFSCHYQIANPGIRCSARIVPHRCPVRHPVEQIQCLPVTSAVDIIKNRLHLHVSAPSTVGRTSTIRIAAGTSSGCTLFHNFIVCFLHFFELLFCKICQWIIHIGVRMIFSCQFSICFFYFFVRCILGNTQNIIRIFRHSPVPFFPSFSSESAYNDSTLHHTGYFVKCLHPKDTGASQILHCTPQSSYRESF